MCVVGLALCKINPSTEMVVKTIDQPNTFHLFTDLNPGLQKNLNPQPSEEVTSRTEGLVNCVCAT